jgi:hypothetical protein
MLARHPSSGERRLARQNAALGRWLLTRQLQGGVLPQGVQVVGVRLARDYGIHTLPQQRPKAMLALLCWRRSAIASAKAFVRPTR